MIPSGACKQFRLFSSKSEPFMNRQQGQQNSKIHVEIESPVDPDTSGRIHVDVDASDGKRAFGSLSPGQSMVDCDPCFLSLGFSNTMYGLEARLKDAMEIIQKQQKQIQDLRQQLRLTNEKRQK